MSAADLSSSPAPCVPSPSALSWPDESRRAAFEHWLAVQAPVHGLRPETLRPASADASFRRYLRIDRQQPGASADALIIMDAPPSHEDSRPFVSVASILQSGGLNVPQVLQWEETQGFMLLSDLGQQTFLAEVQAQDLSSSAGLRRADTLYREALDILIQIQRIPAQEQVPAYDRAVLRRELEVFPQWYIAKHCGVTLTETQRQELDKMFELILAVCEPQSAPESARLVHRDFHSRNLMVGATGTPLGVIDFQDAVWGPVTYDLVSLLRDAYIEWDESIQIDWAARYWERARKAGVPVAADFGSFWRDVEWMGLQRHLKVLGVFSRLWHRDGKDGYLKDLPLVWRYAHHVSSRYSVLKPLTRLLESLAQVDVKVGYTF